MSDISKIDKNFEVKAAESGLTLFDPLKAPFKIYGVYYNAQKSQFERMPEEIASSVSEMVGKMHNKAAGGRVRFRTDSKTVAIYTKLKNLGKMPHFPLTGSVGFDMYADGIYHKTFVPPFDVKDGFDSSVQFVTQEMRTLTINFPLYSGVVELMIGLKPGAALEAAVDYRDIPPIVYYGSSITQGGCASRPGNAYQAIITRRLNIDHINLGFSGNAKGEPRMAEYIASLDMSAFVLDYDYNAPTPEHLQATHKPFFDIIRKAHPTLPIVLVTRPRLYPDEKELMRREIILDTYNSAKAAGDENVYFVDGHEFFKGFAGDSATVDNCHPNDLGFMCMANDIGAKLKEILG